MNAQFESDSETEALSPRRERFEPVKPVDAPSRFAFLRRMSRRQWAIVAVVLLLVIVAVVWATGSPSSAPAPVAGAGNQTLPLVTVATPRATVVRSKVTFSGAIGARYDIPIGVEGEGGRITAVLVEVGDSVRRGQALARLDQSVLLPQLNRLEASLEEARAQAALSQAEYVR
ncbi:MAG TPA: biotin/lipoyl-binding protein, partial [Steroidobacteraceae bacterium]|nr:biotin/lipoyl-binding protein [Steroidobacteraceae bacterium]